MTKPFVTDKRLAKWRQQWLAVHPDNRELLVVHHAEIGKLLDEIDRLREEIAALKKRLRRKA